jgi:hypothetical protein
MYAGFTAPSVLSDRRIDSRFLLPARGVFVAANSTSPGGWNLGTHPDSRDANDMSDSGARRRGCASACRELKFFSSPFQSSCGYNGAAPCLPRV